MTLRHGVGQVLRWTLPPRVYRSIEMNRGRRTAVQWLRSQGVLDLAVKVAERFDYKVQAGPFQGMHYTKDAVLTRHSTPALLGCYESQLYPCLMEAVRRAETIIDIGCAEGYFAVGLARLTGRPVRAFDADPNERKVVSDMAALNGVSQLLTISEWCSPETLIDLVRGKRALVFCDIDGGEFALFTAEVVQALRECDVIIELHGSTQQNDEFVHRFGGRAMTLVDHPKEAAGADQLAFLGEDAERMATEYRDPQQWLVMASEAISSLEGLAASIAHPVLPPVPDSEPVQR